VSLAAASARPAAADEPSSRFSLWLQAGLAAGRSSFTATRTFTQFAEQGRIDGQYRQEQGPAIDAGMAWRFARHFAAAAAASFAHRGETGSYAASLPHPLYFGKAREASGDFDGRSASETAVHLDLAAVGGSHALQWSVFAGPSLLALRVDLVDSVQYTQSYPYDTVNVTGAPLVSTQGNAVGFNVGAGLDWRVAPRVAVGIQSRFQRATVHVHPAAGDDASVTAGGLLATAGVRFFF
jgi:opacity protein-like surface antigen